MTSMSLYLNLALSQTVIMYYIETKAICFHPHQGNFLVHIRLWGVGVGEGKYFFRFYLAVFNAPAIIHNLHSFYLKHFVEINVF
jgi:hypothetical protein